VYYFITLWYGTSHTMEYRTRDNIIGMGRQGALFQMAAYEK